MKNTKNCVLCVKYGKFDFKNYLNTSRSLNKC